MKKYFPEDEYGNLPCGAAVFRYGGKLEIVYANEYYYRNFSNGNTETLNVCAADKSFVRKACEELAGTDKAEVHYKCAGDNIKAVCMSVSRYSDGTVLGILLDDTKRYTMISKLRNERNRYAMVISASKNLVFEHNIAENTSVLYAPVPGSSEIETVEIENHEECMLNEMIHPKDRELFAADMYNDKKQILSARMKLPGSSAWSWRRVNRHFEYDKAGNIVRIYGTLSDIEEEKKQETELRKQFEIDPDLKIYNRNAAVKKIDEYLSNNPNDRDYSLFVLDIDDFKSVNDTYGHLYGDAVIAKVAEILKEIAGDKGVVGRYGGDEFFAFFHTADSEKISQIGNRINEDMKKVRMPDDKSITCSVGIAPGTLYKERPAYKDMFVHADKALYSVKSNGKAHWEIYDDNMEETAGHAISYEADNEVDSEELLESRDLMKVFLELAAGAKTSDAAIYGIIRYVAEKFKVDWFQIMQLNCKEDLITIKYEWCKDPDFRNNAGRSGYYAHSDLMRFRKYFSNHPVFLICPENIEGFSMKFQREFEKNMRYAVLYNANVTSDDSFYMFVCTRFDKTNVWEEKETLELNAATKLMTMYVSQANKETENERRYKNMVDFEKKTGLYNPQKFYEQMGRLRKIAAEKNERVAVIHTDISNFLAFNMKFGILEGDKIIVAYANHIPGNDKPEERIVSHLDGTDIFMTALRIKDGGKAIAEETERINRDFCEKKNKDFPGANLIVKSGVYVLKEDDIGGDGFDRALFAKRSVKNFTESFCALYEDK